MAGANGVLVLQNSVKVAFRCLWPSCGKVLTTVVGIKRHIRTTHLWYDSPQPAAPSSNVTLLY